MDQNHHTLKLKLICSAFLAAGVLSLAGCAQSPKTMPEIGTATQPQSTVILTSYAEYPNLLAFAHAFPNLPLKMQRNELVTLEHNAANEARAKLLLAVIHGLPASRVRDTSKAQPLLEEVLSDKTLDDDGRALATIMQGYLNEISKSGLSLREEQKRTEATQRKLEELQKKLEELQKKLDDLKSIEKTIVDREQGVKK